MVSAVMMLRAQEHEATNALHDLCARAIEFATAGQFVPAHLLTEIATLETQLAALMTVQRYAATEPEPSEPEDEVTT